MSTLTLTNHVKIRLTQTRPLMSVSFLEEIAGYLSTITDRFDPNYIHQVAVLVHKYDEAFELGNSEGDCLIIMVDIRRNTIPTAFLRYERQGKPKAAQRMVNFQGDII